jgi:hypothetical protein
VPHQVGQLTVAPRPVVRDARDAAQSVVRFGCCGVHLADDLVLGPLDTGQCVHRGAHAVFTALHAHRLEFAGRIGQPQFCCVGEQLDDVTEATVVHGSGIQMNQIGEGQPVGDGDLHAPRASR